jgi:hypothetical protein
VGTHLQLALLLGPGYAPLASDRPLGYAAGAMTRADKAVVLLLRTLGVGSLLALVPVFMPFSWMAAAHRWLGLGELPAALVQCEASPVG